jgi:ABC-type transport system involved in cytochrome c biogenesis permease subunit
MQAFKNFIIKELVFTGSIVLIAFFLFKTTLSQFYLPVFWLLLAVVAVLTSIMHFSILQVEEKSTSKFFTKFMIFSGVKMMIYLIMIVAYVFIYPATAKFFLISFIALYFLYTAFEVFLIVRQLKKK